MSSSRHIPDRTSRLNRTLMGLAPSGIREFFELVIGMDDVISLGVGEPDFVTPWTIREHAIATINQGQTSYTSNKGLIELRREVARYLEERFGTPYDPDDEILITVGASQGLDLAMRAIVNPGDEVIVVEPCYVAYVPMVALAGGIPRIVTVKGKDGFHIDLDEMEAAINDKTRAILLNYPANPTGATLSGEECAAIARLAEKHDLFLVSDEIYAELTYEQEHVSMPTVPGARDRTIVLNGFSKAFAMTGWRMAYAAGPPDLIAAMTKIFQYAMLSAPIMSQQAAIEALRTREKTVPEMVESYDQRRRMFIQGLRDIGIDCHLPEGAFYAFPSIAGFGMSSREFCTRLLQEEKVAVVPGTAFSPDAGEGYIRCAYAAGFDEIEAALAGMKRMIERL